MYERPDLHALFAAQVLSEDQLKATEMVRIKGQELAQAILDWVPAGVGQIDAIGQVKGAVMAANSVIALGGVQSPAPPTLGLALDPASEVSAVEVKP